MSVLQGTWKLSGDLRYGKLQGCLGGSVRWASGFGSGHDLAIRFVSLSPASGSVLTAQSLEPASDCVSLSISLCRSPACTLSLVVSLKNK